MGYHTYHTIREITEHAYRQYKDCVAARYKTGKNEVKAKTYGQLREDSDCISNALSAIGEQGKHIALIGASSYEWLISYFGIVNGGSVAVPLDASLPAAELCELINRADVTALFVDAARRDVINAVKTECPGLKYRIVMRQENETQDQAQRGQMYQGDYILLRDLLKEYQGGYPEFPIVKDTTPNMMNPRLYTTSYNKPQGQQFETAVLSFIKLQYTEKSCKMKNIFVLVTILGHLPVILSAKRKGSDNMKQILIVEDDNLLNKTLTYNLELDGYTITSVLNARTAAESLKTNIFDLVLLDINLPDGNGYDLCRLIKPEHPDTVVIFLTANDQESDQIRGYEAGAVDYITKPFSISALQRKIKAMFAMLEHHKPAKDIYEDGSLFLDFSEQFASLNGKPLALSAMEYKMLNLFLKNPKQVLTRQQLLERLWDIDEKYVDEHTLTTSISRIRSKIEADGDTYIKTVYGMGYQWTGGEKK